MICLRYARDKSEAEDILQEGLIQIFQQIKKYDPAKGTFASWSARVIVNKALEYLRKWRRLKFQEDLDGMQEDLILDNSIVEDISAKELIKTIQKLPTGYQVVFNMYTIEGYSHKEIAEQLGISVGTSKSQLSKAKKILRNWIEVTF